MWYHWLHTFILKSCSAWESVPLIKEAVAVWDKVNAAVCGFSSGRLLLGLCAASLELTLLLTSSLGTSLAVLFLYYKVQFPIAMLTLNLALQEKNPCIKLLSHTQLSHCYWHFWGHCTYLDSWFNFRKLEMGNILSQPAVNSSLPGLHVSIHVLISLFILNDNKPNLILITNTT